jgi:hypothetical protein
MIIPGSRVGVGVPGTSVPCPVGVGVSVGCNSNVGRIISGVILGVAVAVRVLVGGRVAVMVRDGPGVIVGGSDRNVGVAKGVTVAKRVTVAAGELVIVEVLRGVAVKVGVRVGLAVRVRVGMRVGGRRVGTRVGTARVGSDGSGVPSSTIITGRVGCGSPGPPGVGVGPRVSISVGTRSQAGLNKTASSSEIGMSRREPRCTRRAREVEAVRVMASLYHKADLGGTLHTRHLRVRICYVHSLQYQGRTVRDPIPYSFLSSRSPVPRDLDFLCADAVRFSRILTLES